MFEIGVNVFLAGCLQLGIFAPLSALGVLPEEAVVISLLVFLLFIVTGIAVMEHEK